MNSNTPLINLSILESLKRNSHKDEIDLIVPYVVLAIDEISTESFEPNELKKILEQKFGFNPPSSAFDVVMTRVVTRKFLSRKNKLLFKNDEKISAVLEKNRETLKEVSLSLKQLVNEFVLFSRENFDVQITEESAELFLFKFINEFISIFAVSLQNGTYELGNKKIKNESYLTSVFIKHLYEYKIDTIKHLEKIVKGALLANYITLADTNASRQKLSHITVIFDTPVLLGLLGYNGASKSKSLKEFLKLLQELEINTEIYDITIDEVLKVMSAWKQDLKKHRYENFNPKTLELLKSKGLDAVALESEIPLVRKKLEKLGLVVSENIAYDKKYQCDVEKFEEYLERRSGFRDLVHDVKCVSRTYSSREGVRVDSLDQPFIVFITHESTFPKVVRRFFKRQKDTIVGKIPIVTTEKWLCTITWFKKPNAFPNMPRSLMVSNAYSIVYSDDKFWSSFLTKLNQIKKRGDITEDDFKLVRWDTSLLELAHNLSVTAGENFSDEDIFDIVDNIKKKIIGGHESHIEELKGHHEDEVNQLSTKLSSQSSQLSKAEQTIASTIDKIEIFSLFTANVISVIIDITFSVAIIWGIFLSVTQSPVYSIGSLICILLLHAVTFSNLYIGTEIRKMSLAFRDKIKLVISV